MAAFKEVIPESGMDEAGNLAAWLMVPSGGYNVVLLAEGAKLAVAPSQSSNIELLEVTADQASTARAQAKVRDKPDHGALLQRAIGLRQGNRLFMVCGKSKGAATVLAKGGGESVKLEISVVDRKEVKASFHFVQFKDKSSGAVKPLTRWKPGDEKAWLTEMNQIYVAQANLYFKPGKAGWVNSPSEYAALIEREAATQTPTDSKIFTEIANQRDTSAGGYNFFLAKNVEHQQRDNRTFGFNRSDLASAFCDDVDWQSELLAHEVGHFLGLDHVKPTDRLMSDDGSMTTQKSTRGHKLARADVQRIHSSSKSSKSK